MAYSYSYFKTNVTEYLRDNFDKNIKILDVGAGSGTYWNYLHPYFDNIDAVEIFEPNINNFNLKDKYKNVYNTNITNFEYDYYDVVIFGDVLEHLSVKDAQNVLKYAYDHCKELIVAVPYLYEQGICHDNVYEIHLQPDLTKEIVEERYPYLKLLYSNDEYGYYIKK